MINLIETNKKLEEISRDIEIRSSFQNYLLEKNISSNFIVWETYQYILTTPQELDLNKIEMVIKDLQNSSNLKVAFFIFDTNLTHFFQINR